MSENLSLCGAQARSTDPDRFYACLFAPADKREALFALLAFNHEIARVREVVSEGIVGEMRLAWWCEALDEIGAGRPVRDHPVARALAQAYAAQSFSLEPLRALIDARSFDLYNEPMADLGGLEAYAKATGGGLHRVMAEILGSGEALDLAEAVGTAWALTGVIRALRIHASRGQIYLPLRELGARGARPPSLLEGKMSEPLRIVIGEIVERARSHLTQARNRKPGQALPAVLPGALLTAHWQRITQRDFDPFSLSSEPPKVIIMWLLLIAAMRGRI